MKHIFIINPEAGKGNALSVIKPAIEGFSRKFPSCNIEVYVTKSAGDAQVAAKKFSENATDPIRIYACGGDGTLNEVANGIFGFENVQLGCIPLGTGNDFVRNFPNKENFLEIKKQIFGEAKAVDLIKCNDRYCVNMLNIGFDSEVALEASRLKSTTILSGVMAYIGGLFIVFKKKYGFHLSVKFDNKIEKSGEVLLCAIANGGYCGGGFHSSLAASLNDGLMEAYLIHKISKAKFLSLLPKYRTGKYIYAKSAKGCVDHVRCKEVSLKADEDFMLCNDGEVFFAKEISVSILSKAINFIVPQGCVLQNDADKA